MLHLFCKTEEQQETYLGRKKEETLTKLKLRLSALLFER